MNPVANHNHFCIFSALQEAKANYLIRKAAVAGGQRGRRGGMGPAALRNPGTGERLFPLNLHADANLPPPQPNPEPNPEPNPDVMVIDDEDDVPPMMLLPPPPQPDIDEVIIDGPGVAHDLVAAAAPPIDFDEVVPAVDPPPLYDQFDEVVSESSYYK